MGKIVSEIKTKNGIFSCFCQNPQNAVITSGHTNGILNLWTPNFSEPVVKIFAHSTKINSVCIDNDGYTLITCGNEQKMKIWDLRNSYKELYSYFNPNTVLCNTISQKNLLAIGYSNIIEIWKDYSKTKQKEPYMKHRFNDNKTKSKKLKFVNFEDFLGIGTNIGFSQISVPGSGYANFDTFENNPYETKNQRRENEIRNLLEKIPYNMITINPNSINKVDPRSKNIIEKEKQEEEKKKAEKILEKQKKKIKMRLKNKAQHDKILKDFERNQRLRSKLKAMIELQDNKKNKEKNIIKKEVKIIKNFIDDFDPELYVQEKEKNKEEEDEDEETIN
jgi:U3 small nucleolar RNA-associated protein 7